MLNDSCNLVTINTASRSTESESFVSFFVAVYCWLTIAANFLFEKMIEDDLL